MTKIHTSDSKITNAVTSKVHRQTPGEHGGVQVKVANAPKAMLSARARLTQALLKKTELQKAIWAHTQSHPIVATILEKRKDEPAFASDVMAQFSKEMVRHVHEGWFRQITPSNPKAELAVVENSMDVMLHAIVSADLK